MSHSKGGDFISRLDLPYEVKYALGSSKAVDLGELPRLRPLLSHRDWCRFLTTRHSLAVNHRPCLSADYCVATQSAPRESWRRAER